MIETRWGLARYFAMHRHWREFGPPLHIVAAAWLGLGHPRQSTLEPEDLADLLGSLTIGTRA